MPSTFRRFVDKGKKAIGKLERKSKEERVESSTSPQDVENSQPRDESAIPVSRRVTQEEEGEKRDNDKEIADLQGPPPCYEESAAPDVAHVAPIPQDNVETSKSWNSEPDTERSPLVEDFGLFVFPPRGQSSTSNVSVTSSGQQHIDIIAVHGLGGHWRKTWQAPDGAIWFQDRINPLFSDTNITCRVRSFGYDSAFVFTKSESSITGCAKDLIDRIRVLRRKDTDIFRPIILVAHSLGGLVVKEAMNIAWTRNDIYDDILTSVKGCIFMGVPHHGAGIARWAKHATQIVRFASFGFAGNTKFLKTLERSSPEWVVDEASAALHVPNEQSFALPGSDHRTVCRFSDTDNERFSLVGDALVDLAKCALKGKQREQNATGTTISFSDLPLMTPTFFGRERETEVMQDTLNPVKQGRKGIVLFGLGGTGKTQLTLHFIQRFKDRYTAILWINASSKEQMLQSFTEISDSLEHTWPSKDLPTPYRGKLSDKRVLARLRSTVYKSWLLVIDSVDDLESINLASIIPDCNHGCIVVTSTRKNAAEILDAHGFRSVEVDSLDDESSGKLLVSSAKISKTDSLDQSDTLKGQILSISRVLYGLPLALEQAGVLIRKRIVTFENFIEQYSAHYNRLMGKKLTPGWTTYEKEHSIIAVVSLVFSVVEAESPEATQLLAVLAALGPQKFPLRLVELASSHLASQRLHPTTSQDGDAVLRLSLDALSDVCLVKFEEGYRGGEEFVSVHGLICQWLVDTKFPDQGLDLTLVAEAVTRFILPDHDSPLTPYKPEGHSISTAYIPSEARRLVEGEAWPSTEKSLELLVGLAICEQKIGNSEVAIDGLKTSLSLAERLFDNFDDRTAEISARLKQLQEKSETDMQHRKAALVASTGVPATKGARNIPQSTHESDNEEETTNVRVNDGFEDLMIRGEPSLKECRELVALILGEDWTNFRVAVSNARSGVFGALFATKNVEGTQNILILAVDRQNDLAARIILELRGSNIDVNQSGSDGRTALWYAAMHNHARVIKTLLKLDADPGIRDTRDGMTPLQVAVNYHSKEAFYSLVRGGSRPDIASGLGLSTTFASQDAPVSLPSSNPRLFEQASVARFGTGAKTPLHYLAGMAIFKPNAVKTLLGWAGPLACNARDAEGRTPLHIVVLNTSHDAPKIMRDLISNAEHLEPELRDHMGNTALGLLIKAVEKTGSLIEVKEACLIQFLVMLGTLPNMEFLRWAKSSLSTDSNNSMKIFLDTAMRSPRSTSIGGAVPWLKVARDVVQQDRAIVLECLIENKLIIQGVPSPNPIEDSNLVLRAAKTDSYRCLEYLVEKFPLVAVEAKEAAEQLGPYHRRFAMLIADYLHKKRLDGAKEDVLETTVEDLSDDSAEGGA
ncbi:hypothetical protein OQA88_8932 [Cercophora sp. LCS_1]